MNVIRMEIRRDGDVSEARVLITEDNADPVELGRLRGPRLKLMQLYDLLEEGAKPDPAVRVEVELIPE